MLLCFIVFEGFAMFSVLRSFLFASLLLTVFLVSMPHQAKADNCPRHNTVMILDPELTKTKFFRGSAARLTEWTTGHTQTVGAVLGLGGGEVGTKFQAAFNYAAMDDGRVCVMLDKVKAIFYAHPRMYIASDYKKGTCEYDAIVTHEKRHVKALIDFHDVNEERLRTHLGRIAKRIPMFGPVSSADIPFVKQRLMDYVMSEYLAYQNKEMMSLQREQRKIDSPSEYRGVARKCTDW